MCFEKNLIKFCTSIDVLTGKPFVGSIGKGNVGSATTASSAHDSDISNSFGENAPKNFKTTERAVCVNSDNEGPASMVTYASSAHLSGERKRKMSASISDDEDELSDKMKKKRLGLSASLTQKRLRNCIFRVNLINNRKLFY